MYNSHDDKDPKNTTVPCSLDGLYICPTWSKQEGRDLLQLRTNHVIMRHKVILVPVNPSIISQVHALTHLNGMSPGLKITIYTTQILFDSAWTAGEDYNEEEFQDEDYEREAENDNEDEKYYANEDGE